jgi:hypothetical protein
VVLISVRGSVDTISIVRLEELAQLKKEWLYRESNPQPSGL